MARLRFPGRPGCRFDRQGVRYGADEAKNVQDPTLSFVASIHRGLLAFRELVGASDEEEDFEGFTKEDLRRAENKLEEELSKYDQSPPKSKSQHDKELIDTSPGKLGTRLTATQESLDNLPTSERTRNRKSTLIRKSYKQLLKEGLATPGKIYSVKRKRDLDSAQDEARGEVKKWLTKRPVGQSPDKPKFQPRFKVTTDGKLIKKHGNSTSEVLQFGEDEKIDIEGDDSDLTSQEEHRKKYKDRDKPSHHYKVAKPTNKGIARQLLQKAKKSSDKGQSSGVKVQKKRFVLPVQSSRSSRVIIPNKRFLEEDSENYLHMVTKRQMKEKDVAIKKDVSTMLSIETPDVGLFAAPPTSEAEKLPILPLSSLSPAIPKTPGLSGFSLFQQPKPLVSEPPLLDQPLIVEGKRTRKPSLKVRMKMSETSFQRFRELSFEKKLQARKAIEQEKQRTVQDSHPETKKILLTPSKLAPTLSPKLPMMPIMAPPKFGVSPFSSVGERERLEKLEREAHATRMRGHNILRKAKLQLNRAALNRSKADLARTLKKEMKKEAKMEEIRQKQQQNVTSSFPAPSGLSFSTTGRGWSEAAPADADAGPGKKVVQKNKKPSRRELMRCRVCDLILKDQKIGYHGVPSCLICWKFFRRVLRERLQRPCQKKKECKIHYTQKPMCPDCRFRKCKSVFPSEDKLRHPGVTPSSNKKAGAVHLESDKKTVTSMLGTEGEDVVDVTEDGEPEVTEPEANHHKPKPVTPQPTAASMMTAAISPVPMATSSPETNDSPRSDGRGPRIKHVCRKAAVVLGKPVAKFPARSPEITLSALPSGEKVKLWKKDQETRKEYSDDEMPIEDIIQQSEDHTVVVRKSPLKSPPKAAGRVLQGKRKKRCMKCEGCQAKECGTCVNCLDNPKFGGPGVKRKACKFRVCQFPVYKKVLLRDNSDSEFGDSPSCSPAKAPHGDRKTSASQKRGTTLSVIQRMALQGQSNNNVGNNVGKKSTRERTVSKQSYESKTPMDVSRQLLSSFGGSEGHGGGGVQFETANFSLVSVSGPGRRPTKFKDKMYGGLKTDGVAMQSVVSARSWIADATMAEHKVKADYRDNLEYISVWQYGVTVTITGPMCVRTVCLLCGSAGKHEFLYCNICCEPFHEFCLEEEERPLEDKLEDWCCKRCQFCHVCGRQNNLLQCDKCQNTYHPECLGPNYPTKPSKRKKIWICTKCVRCKSCGATTPGTGSSATWTYDFQLCYECGQLMDKGNFCPVCHKCYSDDDWESKMVQCVSCESWVHAKCEGLTDEMYERVSYLPEDIHYICRICSPDGVRHWEQVVRHDFLVGIQAIMAALMQAKCSQHLLYIDEEKLKSLEKKFDSQNQDLMIKPSNDENENNSAEHKLKEDPLEVQKKSKQLEQSLEDFVSMLDKVLKSKTKFEIPPPNLNLNVKDLGQSSAENKSCDTASKDSGPMDTAEMKDSDPILPLNMEDESGCGSNVDSHKDDQQIEGCEKESRTASGNDSVSDDEQMEIDVENDPVIEDDTRNSAVISDNFKNKSENEIQEHRDEVDGSRLHACATILEDYVESKNSSEQMPSQEGSSSNNITDLVVEGTSNSEMRCGNDGTSEPDRRGMSDNMNTNELENNEISVSNSKSNSPDEVEECQNLIDQSENVSHDVSSLEQSEHVLLEKEAAPNSSQIFPDLCSSTVSNELNSESTLSIQSDSFLHNQLHQSDVSLEDTQQQLHQSDVSLEDTQQKNSVSFDLAVISKGEVTPTKGDKGHVRFMEGLLNPMSKRDYPKDLIAVERKMELHLYMTLEEFAEDVARIINLSLNDVDETRVIRKKATNSVRSIFIKQLEKHFPWYNTKACSLWENNQNFPQGMLADAVLPPSGDHTYAQWLERQDIPKSPQPSPFKRVQNTPVKKILPILDDEDAEKILFTDLEDAGEDTRRCILCWHYGDSDPNDAGRLLYTGQDDWVHINCALWSAEVYEEEHDGSLKNVQTAVSRGRVLKCDRCQRSGATVGCCTRGCPANYHFMCAKQSYCVFQEDKKMFCQMHRDKVDGELIRKEKFAVLRRVSVSMEDVKLNKKTWAKGLDPAFISIIIGSCTIEDLGKLSPLSDTKDMLLPTDFCSTRVFWSTTDARKRCVYTCTIREVKPNSPTGHIKIRDMTIVHDETHPDFVPFADLDLQGINLFPKKPRMSESMEIIDLSDESSLLRSFNSSGDCEILHSTTTDCEFLNSTARDIDGLNSTMGSRSLSASYHGRQSEREVVEDSLSKSWPVVPKKSDSIRKSKLSLGSVNLSVLSPSTLKLLNIKDPAKYSSPKLQPVTQTQKGKDGDFGTLIKIADRLNLAAANRRKRGKSEERASPGLPPLSQRGRSRSRSVDRLISPPRLALSTEGQSASSSRSSSRSGSVDRVFSPVDSGKKSIELPENHIVHTPLLSVAQSENANKTVGSLQPITEENQTRCLQPIREENQTSSSNETLIVLPPEELENLSEEDCILIAQMALAQGQGQMEDTQHSKPDTDDVQLMDVDTAGGAESQGPADVSPTSDTGVVMAESQNINHQMSEYAENNQPGASQADHNIPGASQADHNIPGASPADHDGPDIIQLDQSTDSSSRDEKAFDDHCPIEEPTLLSSPSHIVTGSCDHLQPMVEHNSNVKMHKVVTPKKAAYQKELEVSNAPNDSSNMDHIKTKGREMAVEEILKKDLIPVYNKEHVLVGFKSPTASDSPEFQKKLRYYREYGIPYYKQGPSGMEEASSSDVQNSKHVEEPGTNYSVLIVPKSDLLNKSMANEQISTTDGDSILTENITEDSKGNDTSTDGHFDQEKILDNKEVMEENSEERSDNMVTVLTEPAIVASEQSDVPKLIDDECSTLKDLKNDSAAESETSPAENNDGNCVELSHATSMECDDEVDMEFSESRKDHINIEAEDKPVGMGGDSNEKSADAVRTDGRIENLCTTEGGNEKDSNELYDKENIEKGMEVEEVSDGKIAIETASSSETEPSKEDLLPVERNDEATEYLSDMQIGDGMASFSNSEIETLRKNSPSLEKEDKTREDVETGKDVSVLDISTESEIEDASVLDVSTESEDRKANMEEDIMIISLGSEDEEQSDTCVVGEFEKHFQVAGEDHEEAAVTCEDLTTEDEDGVPQNSEVTKNVDAAETIEISSVEDEEDNLINEDDVLKEDSLLAFSKDEAIPEASTEDISELSEKDKMPREDINELEDDLLAGDSTFSKDCEGDTTSIDEDYLLQEEELCNKKEDVTISHPEAEKTPEKEEDTRLVNEDKLLEEDKNPEHTNEVDIASDLPIQEKTDSVNNQDEDSVHNQGKDSVHNSDEHSIRNQDDDSVHNKDTDILPLQHVTLEEEMVDNSCVKEDREDVSLHEEPEEDREQQMLGSDNSKISMEEPVSKEKLSKELKCTEDEVNPTIATTMENIQSEGSEVDKKADAIETYLVTSEGGEDVSNEQKEEDGLLEKTECCNAENLSQSQIEDKNINQSNCSILEEMEIDDANILNQDSIQDDGKKEDHWQSHVDHSVRRRSSSEGERNIFDVLQTEILSGEEENKGQEDSSFEEKHCEIGQSKQDTSAHKERPNLFQTFSSEFSSNESQLTEADFTASSDVVVIDSSEDEALVDKLGVREIMAKDVKQEKIEEYMSQGENAGTCEGREGNKAECKEEDVQSEEDVRSEEDIRSEEEKTRILLGLGLARTQKDKDDKQSSYSLTPSTSPHKANLLQGKDHVDLDDWEPKDYLPLHDQIALKIKAESLAKSSPGKKGPFKCPMCKRVYRTKDSLDVHAASCDFEVSTSEDEESSKGSDAGLKKYPLRQSTVVKKVLSEMDQKERQTYSGGGRGRPPKDMRSRMSPKVLLSRLSPRKCSTGTIKLSPLKRGPGRPRKISLGSEEKTGPGRPRKISLESEEKTGPGRPRKISLESEEKTGPGRPRKISLESEVKTGPGRPKKISLEEEKKPGPGRPKKISLDEEKKPGPGRPKKISLESEEKTGPGRPKKISLDEEKKPGPGRPKKTSLEGEEKSSKRNSLSKNNDQSFNSSGKGNQKREDLNTSVEQTKSGKKEEKKQTDDGETEEDTPRRRGRPRKEDSQTEGSDDEILGGESPKACPKLLAQLKRQVERMRNRSSSYDSSVERMERLEKGTLRGGGKPQQDSRSSSRSSSRLANKTNSMEIFNEDSRDSSLSVEKKNSVLLKKDGSPKKDGRGRPPKYKNTENKAPKKETSDITSNTSPKTHKRPVPKGRLSLDLKSKTTGLKTTASKLVKAAHVLSTAKSSARASRSFDARILSRRGRKRLKKKMGDFEYDLDEIGTSSSQESEEEEDDEEEEEVRIEEQVNSGKRKRGKQPKLKKSDGKSKKSTDSKDIQIDISSDSENEGIEDKDDSSDKNKENEEALGKISSVTAGAEILQKSEDSSKDENGPVVVIVDSENEQEEMEMEKDVLGKDDSHSEDYNGKKDYIELGDLNSSDEILCEESGQIVSVERKKLGITEVCSSTCKEKENTEAETKRRTENPDQDKTDKAGDFKKGNDGPSIDTPKTTEKEESDDDDVVFMKYQLKQPAQSETLQKIPSHIKIPKGLTTDAIQHFIKDKKEQSVSVLSSSSGQLPAADIVPVATDSKSSSIVQKDASCSNSGTSSPVLDMETSSQDSNNSSSTSDLNNQTADQSCDNSAAVATDNQNEQPQCTNPSTAFLKKLVLYTKSSNSETIKVSPTIIKTPTSTSPAIVKFNLPANVTPDEIQRIIKEHCSAAGKLASSGGKMKLTPLLTSGLLKSSTGQSVSTSVSQSVRSKILNQSASTSVNPSVRSKNMTQSASLSSSVVHSGIDDRGNQIVIDEHCGQAVSNNIIQSGAGNSQTPNVQRQIAPNLSMSSSVIGSILHSSPQTQCLNPSVLQSPTSVSIINQSYTVNTPDLISPASSMVNQQIAACQQMVASPQVIASPQVMASQQVATIQPPGYQSIIQVANPQPSILQVQQPSQVFVQPNSVVVDQFGQQMQLQSTSMIGIQGQGQPNLQSQQIISPQSQSIINPGQMYQTMTPMAQQQMFTGNIGINNAQSLLPTVNQPVSLTYGGQQVSVPSFQGQGQIAPQSQLVSSQPVKQIETGAMVPVSTSQSKAQNTIVRIFVDGKPVAITTDPSVLQDPNKLMSKITTTKLQSGTYSVSVNAHKVKETIQGNQATVTLATASTANIPVTVSQISKPLATPTNVKTVYPLYSLPKNTLKPRGITPEATITSPFSNAQSTGTHSSPSFNKGISALMSHRHTGPGALIPKVVSSAVVVTSVMKDGVFSASKMSYVTKGQTTLSSNSSGLPTAKTLPRVSILSTRPRASIHPAIQQSPHTVLTSVGQSVLKLPAGFQGQNLNFSSGQKMNTRHLLSKRLNTNKPDFDSPTAKKAYLSVDIKEPAVKPHILKSILNKLSQDSNGSSKPTIIKKPAGSNGANPANSFRKKMLIKIKQKKKASVAGAPGGGEKQSRKTSLNPRPLGLPHTSGGSSHPLIHPQKEWSCLPQPAVEEEVEDTPLSQFQFEQQKQQEEKARKSGPRFLFEINSDDGFSCTGNTMQEAWQQVMEKVQDIRTSAHMKHLSYTNISGASMFGVNHPAAVYLIEQLFGAHNCRNYRFKYHNYDQTAYEEEPPENPSGCVRAEPFKTRKDFDIFNFLMSQYRRMPELDITNADGVEMYHKSSRRATSMDLPMAMRFRKLKEHSREAVGVYRSTIHGRGLFCKRNIDPGEMVIEYSGEVIRATLTDKREKYYESKGIGCYMFRIDDYDVIDATLHGSPARFINHSCEPNCYSKVIQVDGKKHIVIFALTAIKRGEELTYDYKFPIEEIKIPCTCNSKRCRGYLN